MHSNIELFGHIDGKGEAFLYTLENDNNMRVQITNYGGIVTSLLVPDKNGALADVVLGYNNFADYRTNPAYFGVLVGRNCNRIAGAKFCINGQSYELEQNDGEDNLHSGSNSLSYRFLKAQLCMLENAQTLFLNGEIEDMSDGFPGTLSLSVAYTLTNDNELKIRYHAVSDKATIINLTNHSYFNLAGHDSGKIHNQILQMDAPFYMPAAKGGLPLGEIAPVKNTAFDFTAPKPIGADIAGDYEQIARFNGYDHNFMLSGAGYRQVATVSDPVSGRIMDMFTSMPCVQLYTANMMEQGQYKNGAQYGVHHGFCLETQYAPNAVNMPWLASPVYAPQQEYCSTTTYRFRV